MRGQKRTREDEKWKIIKGKEDDRKRGKRKRKKVERGRRETGRNGEKKNN